MNEYYKLEIINVTEEYIYVDLGDGLFKKIAKKNLNFTPNLGDLITIYYNQDNLDEIFVKQETGDGLPF